MQQHTKKLQEEELKEQALVITGLREQGAASLEGGGGGLAPYASIVAIS